MWRSREPGGAAPRPGQPGERPGTEGRHAVRAATARGPRDPRGTRQGPEGRSVAHVGGFAGVSAVQATDERPMGDRAWVASPVRSTSEETTHRDAQAHERRRLDQMDITRRCTRIHRLNPEPDATRVGGLDGVTAVARTRTLGPAARRSGRELAVRCAGRGAPAGDDRTAGGRSACGAAASATAPGLAGVSEPPAGGRAGVRQTWGELFRRRPGSLDRHVNWRGAPRRPRPVARRPAPLVHLSFSQAPALLSSPTARPIAGPRPGQGHRGERRGD
jgi:hypothetical protein